MQRSTLLLLTVAALSPACSKSGGSTAQAPNAVGSATAEGTAQAGGALVPEHGGVVAASAGITTEVVAQAGGKILAYVRGPQGPVREASVNLDVRSADGNVRPVALAWDAEANAYAGYVWGIEPGMKTVEITVAAQEGAPAQTVSSQVNVASVATPPAAKYGGSVEIIGQYAVEIVPARSGDVAFFVMDLQGNAIPPTDVELPRVMVSTAVEAQAAAPVRAQAVAQAQAQAEPVTVQRVDDHFVAHGSGAAWAQAPALSFNLNLSVRGRRYVKAGVPRAVIVAAMPPAIAIAAPVAQGAVNAEATAPTVQGTVVAQPAVGGVVVAQPPAQGVVVAQPGARGAVVLTPPQIRAGLTVGGQVQAPPPPGARGAIVVTPAAMRAGAVAQPAAQGNVQGGARGAVVVTPPAMRAGVAGGFVAQPAMGGAVVAQPAARGAVVAQPAARGVVMAQPAAGGVVAQPAARGQASAGASAQGSVGVGLRVAVPPPPPPPSVQVRGSIGISGSAGVH